MTDAKRCSNSFPSKRPKFDRERQRADREGESADFAHIGLRRSCCCIGPLREDVHVSRCRSWKSRSPRDATSRVPRRSRRLRIPHQYCRYCERECCRCVPATCDMPSPYADATRSYPHISTQISTSLLLSTYIDIPHCPEIALYPTRSYETRHHFYVIDNAARHQRARLP